MITAKLHMKLTCDKCKIEKFSAIDIDPENPCSVPGFKFKSLEKFYEIQRTDKGFEHVMDLCPKCFEEIR